MIEGSEHSSENVVIATNVPILPADEETQQLDLQSRLNFKIKYCRISSL